MYNGDRARHMMMMSDLASYADMLYQLQSYAAYAICVLCNTQYKRSRKYIDERKFQREQIASN